MSVTLNGHVYDADTTFVGADGRGYARINPDTGLTNFPNSVFADMLAEIDSRVDINCFFPGTVLGSEIMLRFVAVRNMTFADNFAGSQLSAETAATGSWTGVISVNATNVGTVVVATGATTGTFATTGAEVTLTTGDVLKLVGPASADATLANISITFKGGVQ